MEHIRKYGNAAGEADFLLFNLGWDKYWGTEKYFGDYPCIDDEVLDYIENLKNLDKCTTELGDRLFMFGCLPLKVENSDGAPIRAIAWRE